MKKKIFFFFLALLIFWAGLDRPALACDACVCSLSRNGCPTELGKKWFFDFGFEQQNWDSMDARDAHTLHHEGHHVHNKTHEEFYHFTLGVNPWQSVTVFAELPYVVRESVEIHSHRRLGEKQTSEGLGDLSLTGVWRFYETREGYLGVLGGAKLPTGSTTEENPAGERYEAELQPGTGSADARVGGVFQYKIDPVILRGSALYVFKSEGDQEFTFGDMFSGYLIMDYLVNPDSAFLKTTVGLDMNLQVEKKQIDHGEEMGDSGGTTLLLGPTLSVKANDHVSLFGNFLFPVYQDLGGVHQELDYVWNAGAKISW